VPAFFIKIYGHVQGVGFRYFTYKIARRLGVTGYVKNADDGSVHIHAEADRDTLNDFLNQVSRGPSMAIVTDVEYQEVAVENFKSFEITD